MYGIDVSQLSAEQLQWIQSHGGIAAGLAQTDSHITDYPMDCFLGAVKKSYPAWLKFLASKKKTRCLQCKKFMPKFPQEMVIVLNYEWHLHIECLGKAIDAAIKKKEEK